MKPSRRTLLRAGAAGVALSAIGAGVVIQASRQRQGLESDVITGPWPELGPQDQWLLPGLDRARMAVADRPHVPFELNDPVKRAAFQRIRRFTVSSNDDRLRSQRPVPPKVGKRILAIGDSVTFGWGIAEADTWPLKLAEQLGVQVLNAGVPANRPQTMARFAEVRGPALQPDIALFVRRPERMGPNPIRDYADAVNRVGRSLGVPVMVVLPPISRFDPTAAGDYERESNAVRAALQVPVVELTPVFWDAQKGRPGLDLERSGDTLRVLDNVSRAVLAEAPATQRDLPDALYQFFDNHPDQSEPLIFDAGHPDEAGCQVFAEHLAKRLKEAGWV